METLEKYAQTEEPASEDEKVDARRIKKLSDIEYPDTTIIKIQHSEFQEEQNQKERQKILIFVNSADLSIQDENGLQ